MPKQLEWVDLNYREKKRYNDIHTINALNFSERREVQCLTLPGPAWIFEQHLVNMKVRNHFSVLGLERNVTTFDAAQQASTKLNEQEMQNGSFMTDDDNGDIGEYLKTCEEQYDLIYLDFCGAWTKTASNIVNTMFRRGVVSKNGYFGLTLDSAHSYVKVAARPGLDKKTHGVWCPTRPKETHEGKLSTILSQVQTLAKRQKMGIKVVKTGVHKEDRQARTMLSLWFKVIF